MSIIRLLIIAGVIWFAFHWSKGHTNKGADLTHKSPNGFVSVVMPDGVMANTVVILAPLNCPSDAAQRADNLSEELSRLGIPNIRRSSYSFNINDPTAEQKADAERAMAVLNGEVPAVFINGMAKANPRAEEVASEYQRAK